MDTTPETPATRTAKVRVIKKAVPKSGNTAPAAAIEKPAPTERKRKVLAVKSTAPATVDVSGLIAVAAYYLAEQRQFEPGHELEDWLLAERKLLGSFSSN